MRARPNEGSGAPIRARPIRARPIGAWPTRPRRRASSPGTASRAAARATRVDADAVSWMTPNRPSGSVPRGRSGHVASQERPRGPTHCAPRPVGCEWQRQPQEERLALLKEIGGTSVYEDKKRESLKEQQQKIRYTVLAGVVQNSSTANVLPLPITWTSIFWENLEKWCLRT